MKTFEQLTKKEQTRALNKQFERLLKGVLEQGMRFNDELNQDDLQARIDKAIAKAERNKTPWFALEYLLEDKFVKEQLEGMAQCAAEDALYAEPNECVEHGIVGSEE